MIKISHEVPRLFLEPSRKFNDYDFCLPHKLDEDKIYRQFFKKSRKLKRHIIMDNSLHELGKAYDEDRLFHWIEEIKPNEFVVPDVWQDAEATLNNANEWLSKIKNTFHKPTPMAVVQATNVSEARECFVELQHMGYKRIGITYGNAYYRELAEEWAPHLVEGKNADYAKMLGRVLFIDHLLGTYSIGENTKIHLLGCQLPQEFKFYKEYHSIITTLDTSNPIIAGMVGQRYTDKGLNRKPLKGIDEIFHSSLDNKQIDCMLYNVEKFKEFTQ